MTTVDEQIRRAEEAVEAANEALEAAYARQEQEEATGVSSEVQQAAVNLAQAVARAQGVDLPLQIADGSVSPVVELPREFVEQGGVGVAVIVAAPPGS